jgi:hypothetical protein
MCAAKVPPTSTKSTSNKPALDFQKLNPAESYKLLELAVQKYPEFAQDVSKAIKATESRVNRESIQKVYNKLVDEVYHELHRRDDYDMAERYMELEGGIEQGELCDVIKRIRKTVDKTTTDEVFEIAFKALLLCWWHISDVQGSRDEDDVFDEDLSDTIDDAKDVAKDMALLWINKGGKVNKDTVSRIVALVEKDGCGDDGCYELKQDLSEECLEEEEEEDDNERVKRIRVE